MIKALHDRGVCQKDIAAQLVVDPKTVSQALKRGSAPKRERKPRGSKREPFQAQRQVKAPLIPEPGRVPRSWPTDLKGSL